MPDLVVAVNGPVLSPGQRLVLSACGGLPGSSVQWQISSINGSPTVTPLGSTMFDAQGRASFRRRVPRAASGLLVEFQAIGFFQIGAQGSSNPVQVTFL